MKGRQRFCGSHVVKEGFVDGINLNNHAKIPVSDENILKRIYYLYF